MSSAAGIIILLLAAGLAMALWYIDLAASRPIAANGARPSAAASSRSVPVASGPLFASVLLLGFLGLIGGQIVGLAPVTLVVPVSGMLLVAASLLARRTVEPGTSLMALLAVVAPLSLMPIAPAAAMLASLVLSVVFSAILEGRALRIVSLGNILWPTVWFASTWDSPDAIFTASWLFAQTITLTIFHPDPPNSDKSETSLVSDLAQPGYIWAAPWMVMLCHQTGFDPVAVTALLIYALIPLIYGLAELDSRSMRLCTMITLPTALMLWPLADAGSPQPPLIQLAAGISLAFLGGITIIQRHTVALREWAIQGAALPVMLLLIASIRSDLTAPNLMLAGLWLVAGVFLASMARSLAFSDHRDPLPVTVYAMAAGAAFSLAVANLLFITWAAMSTAVLAASAAWLWRSTRLEFLRMVALALAALTLFHSAFAIADFQAALAMSAIADETMSRAIWLIFVFAMPACFLLAAGQILDSEEPDLVSNLIFAAAIFSMAALCAVVARMLAGASFDGGAMTPREDAIAASSWVLLTGLLLAWVRLSPADRHRFGIPTAAALLSARGTILAAVVVALSVPLQAAGGQTIIGVVPGVGLLALAAAVPLGRTIRAVAAGTGLLLVGMAAWQVLAVAT